MPSSSLTSRIAPRASSSSSSRRRSARRAPHVARAAVDDPSATASAPAQGTSTATKKLNTDWQIDFCSRPLKDDRGKKVWELLITDDDRSFEHAEYFPNNRINSVELARALERVMEERNERPKRFKFFRAQMQTIITRACNEVDIAPLASRRCQTLVTWLGERVETVYKKHPGYDANAPPLMAFEASAPKRLPDALRGESWAFVALPLVGVREEMAQVKRGKVFGALLDIDEDLPDDTLIPGIAVYTSRAAALAGWTKGLELACISVDTQTSSIVLETGVNDSWSYAFFRKSKELTQEAKEWEQVKRACNGLHFLAIQTDEEAETTDGFWILQDSAPSEY
jgi:hypothetical protein